MKGRERPDSAKLIVGLGNPGPKYAETRHNVGFRVTEGLAGRFGISIRSRLCSSIWGQGRIEGHAVRLALPQTFMNSSGKAVQCLLARWGVQPSRLLVVCDDISLPVGAIRLRAEGSDGGHLGLASVLQEVGTQQVARLRVGIRTEEARAFQGDLTEFVLGASGVSERKALEGAVAVAVEACEVWFTAGVHAAMNRFNRRIRER